MEITFLGTGAAFTKQYFQTNLLVNFNDSNLLIDCGMTCSTSLHKCEKSLADIENVFISHLHADHVGGLEELALVNKYVLGRKVNLYAHSSVVTPLWEHSLRGGLENTENGKVDLEHYFNVHSVDSSFEINGECFQLFENEHVGAMKNYGLLLRDVYFSNDTKYDREIILEMSERCSTIIHDCCFTPNPVHTYYQSLMELSPAIRNKIYLIHYNDDSEKMRAYMEREGFQCARTHDVLQVG